MDIRRPTAQTGFTLMELLMTIAIAAIVATIGIPSFQYVTNSNRVAGEVNGLLGDMQFARGEAIKEGQTVTVCVSTDGALCATGTTTWNSGWLVFSDPNNNQQVAPNEPVLRVQTSFTGSDTFVANNNISAITFNREGFASANGGVGLAGN